MDLQKYDGNIHPDEWIIDLQTYFNLKHAGIVTINNAISLVDSAIKLPTGIDNIEKLRNALKNDVSFKVFKNSNKRKLQSLKYIPERKGGDTSKFISNFRKLCYNSEINDIEEQKKYLYKSLPDKHFDYISNEFYKKTKNVNSINELIEKFEDIVLEESNLIRSGSIIALKHLATGKYLSSIGSLRYTTGSMTQLVFAGSPEPDPNSLWKVHFDKELATYTDTDINLQHVKSTGSLGIYYLLQYDYDYSRYQYGHPKQINRYDYCKSPSTEHTEVSCNANDTKWKFKHSKLENHQGYLKSNDIINLSIMKTYDSGKYVFLRSHDIQFTIGNDTFQEVVCHNERLGGNDEWCIELINEVTL